MKILPIFFSLFSAVVLCLPQEASAQPHDDFESHMAERLEELNSREGEFVRDWEERRQNEGEHFDEAMYEVEKQWMEREIAIEERRIAIDKEFNRKRNELQSGQGGHDPNAWQQLDEEQQQRFKEIDQAWEDLNKERQDYWINRQQDDLGNRRQDFEQHMEERLSLIHI